MCAVFFTFIPSYIFYFGEHCSCSHVFLSSCLFPATSGKFVSATFCSPYLCHRRMCSSEFHVIVNMREFLVLRPMLHKHILNVERRCQLKKLCRSSSLQNGRCHMNVYYVCPQIHLFNRGKIFSYRSCKVVKNISGAKIHARAYFPIAFALRWFWLCAKYAGLTNPKK